MTFEKEIANIGHLIEKYLAGSTPALLAQEAGVSRPTLISRFKSLGVPIRGRSAAEALKWKGMDLEQRFNQLFKAHEAVRGVARGQEELCKRAMARVRRVGQGETQLLKQLERFNLKPLGQFPVFKYNIDIALRPVAVEVHRQTYHPIADTRQHQRVIDLFSQGWHTLYVWVNYQRGEEITCADQIVALLQLARQDPTTFGKYRVVRADGTDCPLLPRYGKHAAGIGVPEALLKPSD